jgi:uncharacterized DUF497 family protein
MPPRITWDETKESANHRKHGGERGRYARLLADGYVVEVEPVKPKPNRTAGAAPPPATPTK